MERIKQALDVARLQREQLQDEYITSAERVGHQERDSFMSDKNRFMNLKVNHARILLGLAIIFMSAMIIWWGNSSNKHDVIELPDMEMINSQQSNATGIASVEKMEKKIAALAEQVDSLSESIAQLETKVISAHLTTDSITVEKTKQPSMASTTQQTISKTEYNLETLPPTASGTTGQKTIVTKSPLPSPAASSSDASLTSTFEEHQPPNASNVDAIMMRKNGPWVINLVSTSSKADADRLAKKALSKDIPTQQQQTTVKGTQYWRVQITGFSTAEDARAYADTAKEQLGLKDAWIMKR